MPRHPDYLTDRADVLSSSSTNGEVRCNIGDRRTGLGIGQDVAMWGLPGFISRPDDPSEAGACEVRYLVDGQTKVIVGGRDNRFADKAGNPEPGDRMITSSGSARIIIKRKNDEVTLLASNLTDDGSTMTVDVNGKTGEINLANGGAIFRMRKDEIVLSVGGTAVTLDKSGLTVWGKHFAANTGGGNLGLMPGGTPPFPGVGSVLVGPAGVTGVASTKWTMAAAFALVLNLAALAWRTWSA